MLLVDVSASMRYGSGPLDKYDYACTIAATLAYLLLRQQDAVGCMTFDDSIRTKVPALTKRTHLGAIVEALAADDPRDKTDLASILRQVAEQLPRRGMIVLISDLLTDRSGLIKGLKLLRQRGHDVMVFHVMDDDELNFPFSGPTRFEGLESAAHLNCNPRALRAGYLEALGRFLDDVRRNCVQNTCDYDLIATSQPLDAALAAYLSNRLGMHHRN